MWHNLVQCLYIAGQRQRQWSVVVTEFVVHAADIKVSCSAVIKTKLRLVDQFSLELVSAARVCHPEAVRGNSLVLPV